MFLVRGFAVWLIIIFAESVNGGLRRFFLAPLIGDLNARRVGFFVGLLLIFLIAYVFIRWIEARSVRALFTVGLLWMILTACFEFGLGLFVMNYSWETILEDYDMSRGGLMGFGLLLMVFIPYSAAVFAKVKPGR